MSEAALLQKCLDDIAEAGKLYKKACDRLKAVAEGIRTKSKPSTAAKYWPGGENSNWVLIGVGSQLKVSFRPGQTAFFLDHAGRAHDCIVDGYRRDEILVSKDGKPFGWFSDDTLFHTLTEAYASLE